MYTYKAELIKVVDGDTVDLKVDMGFKTNKHERFSVIGINAPELRGTEKHNGKLAKQFLIDQLEGKPLLIKSTKQGKYGRWLVSIRIDDSETDPLKIIYIEELMVENGHAVYKDY